MDKLATLVKLAMLQSSTGWGTGESVVCGATSTGGGEFEGKGNIGIILDRRSKSSNIDSLMKENGSGTVHKKDISNAMNSFFCSVVGKDHADKIDQFPSFHSTTNIFYIYK